MCHQFAVFSSYRTTKRLLRHYKGNVLKGKALRTVEPDNSVFLIMAFMSCGNKHKLPNLFVDGNAACLLVCVCVCVYINTIYVV